jgi:GntR family transcriptional regulator
MSLLTIAPRSKTPVYVQIMDQVRSRVRDGEIPPGELLPSVRQLAAELEVNPNTVAKAYLLLETEGILETFPRRGVVVAESAAENAARALERRMEAAIDRMIAETTHLNVSAERVLEAVRDRLASRFPQTRGGR